jgi:hypothetical protein
VTSNGIQQVPVDPTLAPATNIEIKAAFEKTASFPVSDQQLRMARINGEEARLIRPITTGSIHRYKSSGRLRHEITYSGSNRFQRSSVLVGFLDKHRPQRRVDRCAWRSARPRRPMFKPAYRGGPNSTRTQHWRGGQQHNFLASIRSKIQTRTRNFCQRSGSRAFSAWGIRPTSSPLACAREPISIFDLQTPPLFRSDSPTITFSKLPEGKIRLRSNSIDGKKVVPARGPFVTLGPQGIEGRALAGAG